MNESPVKGLMVFLAHVLKWLVGVGAFGFSAFLTWHLSTQLFPGRWVEPVLSLTNFDLGLLAWYLAFVYLAKGSAQRGIALIMFVLCAVGASLTSFFDLFLSPTDIQAAPFDVVTLAVIVYSVATTANMLAGFAFDMVKPEIFAGLRDSLRQDAYTDSAGHPKSVGVNGNGIKQPASPKA